ncbi:MAG: NUDIX domain-containing protein [Candidatus Woesearchaeota archaeon]|nr:MAG: NUDIX domain-containing protein [Candidatus Woesearchaeota archaeon]
MGEINWKDKCWVTTIYLINKENKVLLTWNKNLSTWIPVGGHLNPGETPEEAISREVEEETGFKFEFLIPTNKEGRVRVLKPSRIQIEEVPHHNHHMNIVFIGKCTSYSNKAETDENEKLRWFSERELLDIKNKMLENVWKSSLEAIKLVKS